MKPLLSSIALLTLLGAVLSSGAVRAAPPCEDVLKELRAKLSTAHLVDNDKAKVDELVQKGIARCNADDDKHADEFFDQATAIIGG
jgi:hypothetical protein